MSSTELQLAVSAGVRAKNRVTQVRRQAPEISRVAKSLRDLGCALGLTEPQPDSATETEIESGS